MNDLVHVRSYAGWTLQKSSYRKRLAPSSIVGGLQAVFAITFDAWVAGMRAIVVRKP